MPNLYQETAEPAIPTPALDGDAQADVVVVGGGSTGLSTALHLAEQGARVVLLEAEEPGWDASGCNGGQVNPGLKHDSDQVERDCGEDLGVRMNAFAAAVHGGTQASGLKKSGAVWRVATATATVSAQLARRLMSPSSAFDMPITDMKRIPMHAMWPLAVRAAVVHGRLRDFLGI